MTIAVSCASETGLALDIKRATKPKLLGRQRRLSHKLGPKNSHLLYASDPNVIHTTLYTDCYRTLFDYILNLSHKCGP